MFSTSSVVGGGSKVDPLYMTNTLAIPREKKKKDQIANPKYDSPQEGNPLYKHLLYSTEVDVFLTAKRGPVWLQRQYQLKMERDRELRDRKRLAMDVSVPVALQYMYGGSAVVQRGEEAQADQVIEGEEVAGRQPVYPFDIVNKVEEAEEDVEEVISSSRTRDLSQEVNEAGGGGGGGRRLRRRGGRRKVVTDEETTETTTQEYDVIKEDLDVAEVREMFTEDHLFKFGTANPSIPVTDIPCGGCGALLHCQDSQLPGFIPSQLLEQRKKEHIRSLLCQRCYVIKEYNVALKVNVSPEDYPKTLHHLKDKRALILLVVDLLDFPGSVWPDIFDILGDNKRVILVGNKIDMISPDSKGYVKRVETVMREVFLQKCWDVGVSDSFPQIVSSVCISAKTGYNVEKLIEKVFHQWHQHNNSLPGDIYIIGTTNVGKSSLFNLLIDSDLCKIRAVDLIQKAMTSPVPGTTLNLLKFPVTRPEPHFLESRRRRVSAAVNLFKLQELERLDTLRRTRSLEHLVPGMFNITHTLAHATEERAPDSGGAVGMLDPLVVEGHKLPARLDPTSELFSEGKWCHDTPGTVCPDQIINVLTAEEVGKTLAQRVVTPRTMLLRVGHSLLLGGLARLDYVEGVTLPPLMVTVFCADTLPVNVVMTEGVEGFLKEAASSSNLLAVPSGENVGKMPEMKGEEMTVRGKRSGYGAADIVLSSCGWVMVSPREGEEVKFVAFTPGGRGVYNRPPFLPFSHLLRGKRIQGSPAYRNDRVYAPAG